nr:Chain P, NC-P1 SUBSTRATE PEPTIDE [unidentified]
RQANFLGK